jgi:hypothetical protein
MILPTMASLRNEGILGLHDLRIMSLKPGWREYSSISLAYMQKRVRVKSQSSDSVVIFSISNRLSIINMYVKFHCLICWIHQKIIRLVNRMQKLLYKRT